MTAAKKTVVVKRKRSTANDRILEGLRALWELRAIKAQAEKDAAKVQEDTIVFAKAHGATKEVPLGTFETDELVITGHLMENSTDVLDVERFVEWAKANNHWNSVSTRQIDFKKVEAEVAAGNIPRRDLKRFTTTKPVAPFIRFDKKPKP